MRGEDNDDSQSMHTTHTKHNGEKRDGGKGNDNQNKETEKNTEKGKTKGKKGGNVRPRSLLKPLFALLDVLVKEHS